MTIATKPELMQISTAYGGQKEGSPVLPRNKYTAIQDEKPKDKQRAQRPEYKTYKFTTEAIITEGSDIGHMHTLPRTLVESSILLAATRGNSAAALKEAASVYKLDTDAITAKVKQQFAAKERPRRRLCRYSSHGIAHR